MDSWSFKGSWDVTCPPETNVLTLFIVVKLSETLMGLGFLLQWGTARARWKLLRFVCFSRWWERLLSDSNSQVYWRLDLFNVPTTINQTNDKSYHVICRTLFFVLVLCWDTVRWPCTYKCLFLETLSPFTYYISNTMCSSGYCLGVDLGYSNTTLYL